MTEELKDIRKDLSKKLKKERFEHTIGVMYTASSLAMCYDEDIQKALTAGLLHDCGKYISMVNLGECSYQIVMATEIIGLSHREREIVANVVRYNHQPFAYYEWHDAPTGMDSSAYLTIAKLTAILRVANGLDRSHKQKFKDFKTTLKDNQLVITVNTTEDITLEKGLFAAKAAFFEEVFSVRPVIKQKKFI